MIHTQPTNEKEITMNKIAQLKIQIEAEEKKLTEEVGTHAIRFVSCPNRDSISATISRLYAKLSCEVGRRISRHNRDSA